MGAREVIELLGGTVAAAKLLGVTHVAVVQWAANGAIPPLRAIQIEKLTNGEVRAVDVVTSRVEGLE